MKQFSSIRLLLACLLVAVVSADFLWAQGSISVGGYVAERGGWNTSVTAVARGDFLLANLPDVGVEALYSITRSKDASAVLNIGLLNFGARSVSYGIFSGRPTNDFVMNANALYASASLGLRFYKFLGLPEFSLFLRTGVPIRATYTSTVDVFEVNGTAQLPTGQLKQYTLPNDRMQLFTELGADIGVARLSLGEGVLTLYVQGAMTMTQLVRMLPFRQIPDNFNIIGKDPLAGLRTMNLQPVSVSIGLRYGLEVAAINVAPN